ncbi:PIN domain-containing protein [Streptomyces sp. APSN-46.1]|uniref:PIN domain-containing protein n=1 Tax=Streptomyces sp. APSN-46.1 TaxID=2929049 RepID=UPI001FB52DFF|nr:PIN domain-containing protein [Streptomyces sp. APSN-46.1]MCJ1677356.1 PIN domain-containing protein [Streptomyces sp. APSN-46.1]
MGQLTETEGTFLIDTSAAHRITLPGPFSIWRSALAAGRVGMCAVTEAEALCSARSPAQYADMRQAFADLYVWHEIPEDVWVRVRAAQSALAEVGCVRSAGVVDLVLAVTAARHRLTVLHYDRDFETLAKHIDLRTRWLAEPGSID